MLHTFIQREFYIETLSLKISFIILIAILLSMILDLAGKLIPIQLALLNLALFLEPIIIWLQSNREMRVI